MEEDDIEGQIDGHFSGWLGESIYTLKNGQRWQQVVGTLTSQHNVHEPKVRIYRDGSTMKMAVVGTTCFHTPVRLLQ